ncbi:MAG TPA: ferritin family protein [Candidatus Aminicenantes bacterium]|nr:ferritin family protein [Candidatus Aminicenantes bacterium]HRY66312.1 ferritin family protein [Candidatus Aminicenantes bacterium]HRZ73241.1 ferritin family protein [Candidatus Aminicenantes bacterium]
MTEPRFASIADILSFAVQREIEAAAGYALIEARAATPSLGRLAGELRGQEEEHRRLLEGLTPAAVADLAARYTPDMGLVDGLADEPPADDMSIQEMLIFAARKEARAMALYDSLAGLAGTSGNRGLFRFLADQERGHKLRIEAEYEALILAEN